MTDAGTAAREEWVRKQLAAAPAPSRSLIASLDALRAAPNKLGQRQGVLAPLSECA